MIDFHTKQSMLYPKTVDFSLKKPSLFKHETFQIDGYNQCLITKAYEIPAANFSAPKKASEISAETFLYKKAYISEACLKLVSVQLCVKFKRDIIPKQTKKLNG